jgi:hypothetical protein
VSAPNRLCSCFRKAEALHFTFLNQVIDRPRHILDGRVRINAMLIEQIDGPDFSRIEEGDATLNRSVKKRDRLLRVGNRAFIMAHSHSAEPKGRHFQIAVSKFSLLRFLNSWL